MRGVHIDPDDGFPGSGVQHRTPGSDRFGERQERPAMQQTERLGVAHHWHGGDDPIRCRFDDVDTEFAVQSTHRQARVRPAQDIVAICFLIHPRSIRTGPRGRGSLRQQQGVLS